MITLRAARSMRTFLCLACALVMCARACAWTQEAYVWQREQDRGVRAAITAMTPLLDGVCVLAAEISWVEGKSRVAGPWLDQATLKAAGKPVALALRIGAFGGPFASDDETARLLAATAKTLLARAAAAGVAVSELQLDFDCAETKLDGYRLWVQAVRSAVEKTPLVITALPTWLRQPAFKRLAQATDGFVLQVHSLEKPASPDAAFTLCDPARAQTWVAQASRLGVPFRVALPTYGYRLAFDATGNFFSLSAEGPRPAWPAGTHMKTVRTDPVAMVRLADDWARSKPAHCTGIIWFRLPVAGDELNWDPVTFTAVLRGELPVSRLEAEVRWSAPGLVEITLVNRGQLGEPLPAEIILRWPEAERVLTMDGLCGYTPQSTRHAPGLVTLTTSASRQDDRRLAPGARQSVAWLRFSHEITLSAQLPAPR